MNSILGLWRFIQGLAREFGPPPDPPGSYHPYTRDFDVVTEASALDRVLGPSSPLQAAQLAEAREVLHAGLIAWRASQHLRAAELAAGLRAALSAEAREDIVVSLLFDQSGSMRGQKALFCAAAADVCQEFLASLRIRVEVLGFTTVRWKGGRSRRRWISRGVKRDPGRLNDLLHVVYRDASDGRVSTGNPAFDHMLRPDLYKENIDGEALLWAVDRLRARPEGRKILIVISDGAAVDDSTLSANDGGYLENHLLEVIADIKASPDIELAAVGVGFDVGRYYAESRADEAPEAVAGMIMDLVSERLKEPSRRR